MRLLRAIIYFLDSLDAPRTRPLPNNVVWIETYRRRRDGGRTA